MLLVERESGAVVCGCGRNGKRNLFFSLFWFSFFFLVFFNLWQWKGYDEMFISIDVLNLHVYKKNGRTNDAKLGKRGGPEEVDGDGEA